MTQQQQQDSVSKISQQFFKIRLNKTWEDFLLFLIFLNTFALENQIKDIKA